MEAKELRKGNYVTQDGEFIKGITTNSIHKFDIGQIVLDPIPLTEEWLLKFGFIHDIGQNKSYYSKEKLTINIPDDYHKTGRTYFNSWAIIEYSPKTVHHLMNLYFALTQEELCLKP